DRCVYDAGRRVRVEQAGVENENCDERREPELAGLEDDVQIPEITPERALRFVAYKLDPSARLVLNVVQVIETPFAIDEPLKRFAGGRGSCRHVPSTTCAALPRCRAACSRLWPVRPCRMPCPASLCRPLRALALFRLRCSDGQALRELQAHIAGRAP